MTEVLHRYRFVIIALSVLLFAILLWLLLSRQETAKMPTRGVFVLGTGGGVSRSFDRGM